MKLVSFDPSELTTLLNGFTGKRIAVVGDLMLDRYFWGSVKRISPEAPVPVVDVEDESTRLGGAANVANNIASLGAVPVLIGACGTDASGQLLREAIVRAGFTAEGVVDDAGRSTTVKTRVIAHGQHVVRIDRETRDDISTRVEDSIMRYLEGHADTMDGIILEDYNKGVLTARLIERIRTLCRQRRLILTVDPKFHNFFSYTGATVFKPNRKETEEALGVRLRTKADIEAAGRQLMERLACENVLLTLGEEGMALFERSGASSFVPTKARHVADVSGAGDTVIATLTVALAAGAGVKQASALANVAGGVVCGEVGIVPIDREGLQKAVLAS